MRFAHLFLCLLSLGMLSTMGNSTVQGESAPFLKEGEPFARYISEKMGEGEYVETLKLIDRSLLGENAAEPVMNEKWLTKETARFLPSVLNTRNQALIRLNRSSEIDEFLEKFETVYASSWRALQALAQIWNDLPSHGRVVSGKFYRGNQQRNGQFASSLERDRARACQLMFRCIPLAQADEDTIAAGWFFLDLADFILKSRNGNQTVWELQDLTDLSVLPDIETENPYGRRFSNSRTRGVPLDENGTPLTFSVPESLEKAQNDGERWRWMLEEAVRLNHGKTVTAEKSDENTELDLEAAFRDEVTFRLAQFFQMHYGEQTLNFLWNRLGGSENAEEQMVRAGSLLALETLTDSETIAQTAAGIRRFTMPEDGNYISLYRQLAERPNPYRKTAQSYLGLIAMNRRQYPRAVEAFKIARELPHIPVHPEFSETLEIPDPLDFTEEITGNWVRFLPQKQQTSEAPQLSIRFRNAKKAEFTAIRVDLEKLFRTLREQIEKASAQTPGRDSDLDQEISQLSIEHLAYQLLQDRKTEFLTDEKSTWSISLDPAPDHRDTTLSTPLKVSQPGVYWVEMQAENGNRVFTTAWVQDVMLVNKKLNGRSWYYAADSRTGKPIPGAKLEFLGFRREWVPSRDRRRRNELRFYSNIFTAECDPNGSWIGSPENMKNDDHGAFRYAIAVRRPNGERIETISGIHWGSMNFSFFHPTFYSNLTAFGITDRPIYRPEEKVNFKFWVSRAVYGQGNYLEVSDDTFRPVSQFAVFPFPNLSAGAVSERKLRIRISDPNGENIEEREVTSDCCGAVSGEFILPKDAKLGQYAVSVWDVQDPTFVFGQVTFRMEEYRKPEFEVKINAPKEPARLGDTVKVSIESKYYFGAPVANGTVQYRVFRETRTQRWYAPAPWDWLYGPAYWWSTYDAPWFPGWRSWGCAAPLPPWFEGRNYGGEELVLDGEIRLTPEMEGKAEILIDSSAAAFLYPDADHQYRIEADVVDASRRTISGKGTVLAARKPFEVNVWTHGGYARVGDQVPVHFAAKTLDGKAVEGNGTVRVFEVTYEKDGTPKEKELQKAEITTDAEGLAHFQLKADHPGQFRISCTLTSGGEAPKTVEGAILFTVHGDGATGKDLRFNELELIPDKSEYRPGETVRLLVNTNLADASVVLFERCENGICSVPRIIPMNGKSQIVELPVRECDQPNFFVEALVTANSQVYTVTKEICVPPAKRILDLEAIPSKERFLPGEKAEITLKLTDADGKPFVGQTVLTVYDKSLEYVSGGPNVGDIYAHFWNWKRHHYPETRSTNQQISRSMTKPREPGMTDLGFFHYCTNGGIGQNRQDPIMFAAEERMNFSGSTRKRKVGAVAGVGARRMEAMALEENAVMNSANGALMAMPMAGAAPTAEAPMLAEDGMAADMDAVPAEEMKNEKPLMETGAVSNGIGDPASTQTLAEAVIRKNFADTAYWTASLETDENGIAKVDFPMPENLTTWKVCAWAMGDGTRVGKAETEILTAKNLILRMQTPRFATTSDEIVLTANVHNYLETEKSVKLSLPKDAPCRLLDDSAQTVTVRIPAQGEARVDWRILAENEGECSVTMSAQTDEESDAMLLSFPIQIHGMAKQDARSGMIPANMEMRDEMETAKKTDSETVNAPYTASGFMEFTIPEARRPQDSALEIRFSPTLAGAMLDAIPYLVEYPYGCTEQTVSRFLPAVLVRKALNDAGVDLAALADRKTNLNAQEIGDARERNAQWEKQIRNRKNDPVFDEAVLNDMVSVGVDRLVNMQCADGGWGWFSGAGETSCAHLTSIVVRGLLLAQKAEVFGTLENPESVNRSIQSGLSWLAKHQEGELEKLRLGVKLHELYESGKLPKDGPIPEEFRDRPWKNRVAEVDVLVFATLTEAGWMNGSAQAMSDFIFRDRVHLSPQSNAISGIAFFQREEIERFQTIRKYLTQFLIQDDENQTAHLSLPGFCWWWCWYGNDIETQAAYLRLLCLDPDPETLQTASRLVKYLLNHRKNATYWNSTRDTAQVLEAFTHYLRTTNELEPQMKVEIFLDGKLRKTVNISPENLFTADLTFLLEGEAVTAGTHRVELRKTGTGPLYFNGYARYFTLEDFIPKTGLEVKVERKYFRLKKIEAQQNAAGSRGQLVKQNVLKYERIPMDSGETVSSGDLIEVELTVESKNDYSYILIEDMKPAGFENVETRSGYDGNAMGAYIEYRDNRTAFFVRSLNEGTHSVSYRLRAETPRKVSALPARIEAMYAPELKGNSDEMKLECVDKPEK